MLHDEDHTAHNEQRENRQLSHKRHFVHHHGGLHADKRHDGHNDEEPEAQSQNRHIRQHAVDGDRLQ